MGKRRVIQLWLIGTMLWVLSGSAWAQNGSGGSVNAGSSAGTSVEGGVVVDYMGTLRFTVLERTTQKPLPGASVEIYIPSLNRYVLFGITDGAGNYELNICYNMNPFIDGLDESRKQFTDQSGEPVFQGDYLYLTSETIQYKIYKAKWGPDPVLNQAVLDRSVNPQIIIEHLYKKGDPGSIVEPGNPSTPRPVAPPKEPGAGIEAGSGSIQEAMDNLLNLLDGMVPGGGLGTAGLNTGGIPETGIEGAVPYWLLGLLFFVLAAGILRHQLKKGDGHKGGE